MLKKCLNLFVTGIILTAVGGIGLATLGVNGLVDSISFSIPSSSSSETIPSENFIIEETDIIDSLEFSIDAGIFEIIRGEKFSISSEGININDLEYEISGGCLEIDYSESDFTFNFSEKQTAKKIIITVPERTFEDVKFSVNAGELKAENIIAKDFVIDFNAGSAEFDNIQATSSSEISMDFGSCIFKNSVFNDVEVNMDAGEMNFEKCKLTGTNDIDIDLGALNMDLIGKRSNYEFNINNDLGEVTVDGVHYSGENVVTTMLVEVKEDGTIENVIEPTEPIGTIIIDLDLGECNINFMEE